MVSFDLNKYQTLLDLNDEPSLETEIEYVPYYWVSNYYEPINKKIIRTYPTSRRRRSVGGSRVVMHIYICQRRMT